MWIVPLGKVAYNPKANSKSMHWTIYAKLLTSGIVSCLVSQNYNIKIHGH